MIRYPRSGSIQGKSAPSVIIGGTDVNYEFLHVTLICMTHPRRKVNSLTSARGHVEVALLNNNSIIVIGGTRGGDGVEANMACSLTTVEIGNIVLNQ